MQIKLLATLAQFALLTYPLDVVIGTIVKSCNLLDKFSGGSPEGQGILSVMKIGKFLCIVDSPSLQSQGQVVGFPGVALVVFLHQCNVSCPTEKRLCF